MFATVILRRYHRAVSSSGSQVEVRSSGSTVRVWSMCTSASNCRGAVLAMWPSLSLSPCPARGGCDGGRGAPCAHFSSSERGRGGAVLATLRSQPAYLLQQPAVLYAKRSRLAAGARELLGEDRQDAAQALQAVEQMIAVGHPDPETGAGWPSGAGPWARQAAIRRYGDTRAWHLSILPARVCAGHVSSRSPSGRSSVDHTENGSGLY